MASSIHQQITDIIKWIGDDPTREGLKGTPSRVYRSYQHLFSGYKTDPKTFLTKFSKENYDEMIVLAGIEIYSTCEHHMLPFFGECHIGYIIGESLLGISKLARFMEVYARRLQLQERLTDQITSAIVKYTDAKGAGCLIRAQHFCMLACGVEKQNSVMITSSLKGCFREPSVKDEFFRHIEMGKQ